MVTRPPTKKRRPEGGGAAVEFALIMPIFVAILFGMIDYGWYFYQKFTLVAAVREGVRYGVTFKDNTSGIPPEDAAAEAQAEAIKRLDATAVPSSSVTWSSVVSGVAPLKQLRLEGTFTFKALVGLVPMPPTTVKYSMTMMLEKPYN